MAESRDVLSDAAEIPAEPHPALTAPLTDGELQIAGRLANASNATYLAVLTTEDGPIECVYKPIRGERPRRTTSIPRKEPLT